jgi:hypothetical protein
MLLYRMLLSIYPELLVGDTPFADVRGDQGKPPLSFCPRFWCRGSDWLTNLRQLKKCWVYAAFGRSIVFVSPTMVRREARTGSGSGAGSSQRGAKACQPR